VSRKHLLVCGLLGAGLGVLMTLGAVQFFRPSGSDLSVQVVQPSTGTETLRSEHFVFGKPLLADTRYNFAPAGAKDAEAGISILVREGFVVGHCDRFKVPLWVCYHWTRKLYHQAEKLKGVERDFRPDYELPEYARGEGSYHNSGAETFDRGHMSNNKDNGAWGEDNQRRGDFMSNIVPQKPRLNEQIWKALEDAHRKVVASGPIKEVWIICGSIFDNVSTGTFVGNQIGVPQATYKIVAWFGSDGDFCARGYIMPQDASEPDPAKYLMRIAEIEARTGICFFPEMEAEAARVIKSLQPASMWGKS
jgi:endonuclease G, mitochondrial